MPAGVPGRSLTACISVVVAMLAVTWPLPPPPAFLAVAAADDGLDGDPAAAAAAPPPPFDEVRRVGSLPRRTIEAAAAAEATSLLLPLVDALGLSLEWWREGRVEPSSSQGHTLSSTSFDE